MGFVDSGVHRSRNLERTKEPDQTEVPTWKELLSSWRDRVLSLILRSIPGEPVNFMFLFCAFAVS